MSPVIPIRIFTAPGCPHCDALRADLERRGVRFIERDVRNDPEALEELRSLSWEHRLPVVADHERVTIGYDGHSSTFEELGIE